MTKLLDKLKTISIAYILWVAIIFVTGIWSISHLSFNPNFPYYHDITLYGRPLASFAHFDGIHYLRIIEKGYDDTGSQAFFPFYPMLIKFLSYSSIDPLYLALLLNASAIFGSLYIISLRLKIPELKRFLFLFLSFPTSFFFLSAYTESVFIFFVVLFFHFLSKKNFVFASVIAGIASMTRLVGIFLALSLAYEIIRQKKLNIWTCILLVISVSGLIGYMYYLYVQFGDPLMFIHVQSMFSNGRSGGSIIFLPQVIFRYVKILLTVSPTTILFLRALFELVTFLCSFVVLYYYRHKIQVSVMIFCIGALILPTLSGTLSSYPRYLLAAYPIFIALSEGLTPKQFGITVLIQCVILIISVALFVQGIFIA